jgi:hypothetical protein
MLWVNLVILLPFLVFSKKKKSVGFFLNFKIIKNRKLSLDRLILFNLVLGIWEPSKSASVKTASNEIQKIQFGQRQHTRNQNSQFQNSQNS